MFYDFCKIPVLMDVTDSGLGNDGTENVTLSI